jgi:hypothetical protein
MARGMDNNNSIKVREFAALHNIKSDILVAISRSMLLICNSGFNRALPETASTQPPNLRSNQHYPQAQPEAELTGRALATVLQCELRLGRLEWRGFQIHPSYSQCRNAPDHRSAPRGHRHLLNK